MGKRIVIIILVLAIGAVACFYLFGGGSDGNNGEKVYTYVPGEYFAVNIKNSNRLIKVSVTLELSTGKNEQYLIDNNHKIRDVIISVVRNKTEEELRAATAMDSLRGELIDALKEKFEMDYLINIEFTEFVIQ